MERSEALSQLISQIQTSEEAFIQLELGFGFKELRHALEDEGYFVVELDRAPIFSKESLLHASYQACYMPAYFGFNWDALADHLTDFSWIVAEAYVLAFKDLEVLKERDPEAADTFQSIMQEVGERRRLAGKKPLKVLYLPSKRTSQ